MADPLTTATLVLMYFVTPPQKVPPNMSKEDWEAKAVWTLQSTDHIEMADSTTCVAYAVKLLAAVDPVRTMTLRPYCLCPGDGDKLCYAPADKRIAADTLVTPKPTIQSIGRKTKLPEPPPRKSGPLDR